MIPLEVCSGVAAGSHETTLIAFYHLPHYVILPELRRSAVGGRNQVIRTKLHDVQLDGFAVVLPSHPDLGLLHETIFQENAQTLAVVVEVFLQQRHDAVMPHETQVFGAAIPRLSKPWRWRRKRSSMVMSWLDAPGGRLLRDAPLSAVPPSNR